MEHKYSMDYIDIKNLMNDKAYLEDIIKQTRYLDEFYDKRIPLRQRIFHIESNHHSLIVCKVCLQPGLKWSEKNKKYSTYCNSTCAQKDPLVRSKTELTCMTKFGESTNLKLDSTRKDIVATNLEKYGVSNYSKSAEFKAQFKEVCKERHGVDNPAKLDSVKKKADQTNMERYGRKRHSQSHIAQHIIDLKNNKAEMEYLYCEKHLPVYKIAEMLGVNHSQLCIHFKDNLGIELRKSNQVSLVEREIKEYIDGHGIISEASNRKIISPKEIDIYIPDLKLGFEIDGLAWHSELRHKDRNYHLDKTNLCKDQDVRLVHIFDSEWENKGEIVKSRISNLLGKNKTIYARKCTIKELTTIQESTFFNLTHIQGTIGSTISYGLFLEDELVAAMSFGKSRYNKSAEWELLRYSNTLYTSVVGGASKLFKFFIKEKSPNSVISYSDIRWNTGNVYLNLGFSYTHSSGPNYWYTKNYRMLESRIKFQKHKLANILPNFDRTLTEWENMQNNGYDRIWDCGNSVYLWSK